MLVEEQHGVHHVLENVGSLRRVEQRGQGKASELVARLVGEQSQHGLHADGVNLHK